MNKKKLLFLTVHFDTGGTEKVTFDIITHLDPEKYDITLMSMYGGGYFWDRLPEYVHKKYFFPKFRRFVIRYVTMFPAKMVYRTFIKEKYDVEIACGQDIPARVIGSSVNKKSQKICWVHMDSFAHGYAGHEMKTEKGRRSFYLGFDRIVNVSKECEQKFKQKYGEQLPTCVIYNPIDVSFIRSEASKPCAFTLPNDVFNIVAMGRFTGQKGFDRLINACEIISSEANIRPFHLSILGDGYEYEKYSSMISQKGLSSLISLAGYFENPYNVMIQADLFVLSSRDESFSLAVAEAMTLKIPIMSTRCTGPNELLEYGKTGLLVENSTEGITDGLRSILKIGSPLISQLQDSVRHSSISFDIDHTLSIVDHLFSNFIDYE